MTIKAWFYPRTQNRAVNIVLNSTVERVKAGLFTNYFLQPQRPGDPGWVGRARVPMPDNKEFVARPNWQSYEDLSNIPKKEMSLLEKHKRKFADKRKLARMQHAVKISLEGKNMKL